MFTLDPKELENDRKFYQRKAATQLLLPVFSQQYINMATVNLMLRNVRLKQAAPRYKVQVDLEINSLVRQ